MGETTLLVLAAGLGQRYGGLKQIDPVGPSGETILDYSLYDALRAGFSRVVFVIREEFEKAFRGRIGKYWETRLPTRYIFQEIEEGLPVSFSASPDRRKPWGTGHAVLVSGRAVNTPFAVINADDFYGPSAYLAVRAWLQNKSRQPGGKEEYCFVGYRLASTLSEFGSVSRGVCSLDEEGFLGGIVERVRIEKQGQSIRTQDANGRWVPLRGDEIVSLNLWGFTSSIFSWLRECFACFLEESGGDPGAEFFLPSALNRLIKAGKVRVRYLPTAEKWFGVTYPEDLELARDRVRELVAAGIYPRNVRG